MFKDVEYWCKLCVDCVMEKLLRNIKRVLLLFLFVEGVFDRFVVKFLNLESEQIQLLFVNRLIC